MRVPVEDFPAASAARPTSVAGRNATILFLSALTIMAGATISPALPAIEAHFAESPNAALLTRLILTVPALSIAFCAPVAGVFADRYGRRPVALASVLLYAAAGMSGLYADSLLILLVGRALLGVAVAGIMTVATALVGDFFTGPARERFMGRQSAFIGIGGLFFLTGGGLLAEFHWRAPFAVYAISLALLPAVLLFIPEPRRASAAERAQARQEAGPLFTLPLLAVFGVAILNSVVFYLMPTQLPFHLQGVGVDAPVLVGVAMGLMTLCGAVVSFFYGRVRALVSVPGAFALGFSVMAAGLLLAGLAGSFAAVLPAAALVGCGLGTIMPTLGSASMALASDSNRGRVSGMLTGSIFLGQFISPFASQPLVAEGGYATAFGVGAASILIASLIALAVAGGRRRRMAA
ncbi:MFS transporter [Chelativorans sp.]|uniref:MFS transporter n=1 Tax=Chelativorans sp. TaxID=2203393 RepID=UPI00281129D2|nr:MFS transporter [Chelativorans sp.]